MYEYYFVSLQMLAYVDNMGDLMANMLTNLDNMADAIFLYFKYTIECFFSSLWRWDIKFGRSF